MQEQSETKTSPGTKRFSVSVTEEQYSALQELADSGRFYSKKVAGVAAYFITAALADPKFDEFFRDDKPKE